MAENITNCAGSSSGQLNLETPLSLERNRLGKHIISVLDNSEEIWRSVSEKQLVLHRLYGEEIVVSDKFTEYNLTWRNRDYSISENIETFHIFTEIDHQVEQLSELLTQFEVKLNRSGKIIRDFISLMKSHIASLKKSLDTVIGAKSLDDLVELHIPNLEWIQTIPNPEIELLAEEWDLLRLDSGITNFLAQLRGLVLSTNENPDLE